MTKWHDLLEKNGKPTLWPYPIRYDKEQEIETDVLIIGGGIAGCWAAISAARTGVKVALVEKADTIRSGAGGPGCDHWCVTPANPHSKVDPDDWAKRLVEHPELARTSHPPNRRRLPTPMASAPRFNAARTGIRYWKWNRWVARSGTLTTNTWEPKAAMTTS